jgi:hypothetical protein
MPDSRAPNVGFIESAIADPAPIASAAPAASTARTVVERIAPSHVETWSPNRGVVSLRSACRVLTEVLNRRGCGNAARLSRD